MNDTLTMPDFSRKVYLYGKNKKGETEMYVVEGTPNKQEWDWMCETVKAFTWSYKAWCWNK